MTPPPTPNSPYHHGNLAAALVDAAFALARTGGPEAVIVREASRRVGVSHNAAYRHFPDRDALLAAVCDRCMSALARLMEEMIEQAPLGANALETAQSRLRATGAAYVHFATSQPGLFRTAFSVPASLEDRRAEAAAGASGLGPLDLLNRQLDELAAAGGIPVDARPGAELVAWSAVHGFSLLLLDGPLRELPIAERARALEQLLSTVTLGLGPAG